MTGTPTYRCARCGYNSSDPEQFRRCPGTIFNECADQERCDQAVLVLGMFVRKDGGQ